MLFQRLTGITGHAAILTIVVLAADGKRLLLIGLQHLQALWAQDGLPERQMMDIAKGEGDIAARTNYSTG